MGNKGDEKNREIRIDWTLLEIYCVEKTSLKF